MSDAALKPSLSDRLSTLVVAVAGATLGFIINYALYVAIGPAYPVEPTTFVAVALGCFLVLRLADRFIARARREMLIVSVCILIAGLVVLVLGLRPS